MLEEGRLIRFNNFVFKNGARPKPKYFIVLKRLGEDLIMASLPTSQDHLPDSALITHGCVNIPERCISAFVFAPGSKVTEAFAFPLRTYVYGEQVDEYSLCYLKSMPAGYEDLGQIHPTVFSELCYCLKHSPLIKRKYARVL